MCIYFKVRKIYKQSEVKNPSKTYVVAKDKGSASGRKVRFIIALLFIIWEFGMWVRAKFKNKIRKCHLSAREKSIDLSVNTFVCVAHLISVTYTTKSQFQNYLPHRFATYCQGSYGVRFVDRRLKNDKRAQKRAEGGKHKTRKRRRTNTHRRGRKGRK